jgi:hypothetical protein
LEKGAGSEINTCMEIEMGFDCVGVEACINRRIEEMCIVSLVGALVVIGT